MAEIVAAAASAAGALPDTSGVYHEVLSGMSGVLVTLQSFEPVLVIDHMFREAHHGFREAVEIQLSGLRKPVDPLIQSIDSPEGIPDRLVQFPDFRPGNVHLLRKFDQSPDGGGVDGLLECRQRHGVIILVDS